MLSKRRGLATVALLAVLAISAAACSGSGEGSSGEGSSGKGAPAHASGGKKGGTLNILGAGDVDHIDPASAYNQSSNTLLRTVARQLLSYPASTDQKAAVTPVPDLATDNAAPTDAGRIYTFTIRDGAKWDTTPARQITGADAERGFKRLCSPVNSSAGIDYYLTTVVGMKQFCDPFAKVAPTAAAIKAYVEGHFISGITSTGNTVTIKLIRPAADFVNILALPFSSPMPVEMLSYLPDDSSFRANFISDGPYRITKYVAEKSIRLARNPAWDATTDPLRKAWVDSISITEGADEGTVFQQLQAGTADMQFDTYAPMAQVPSLVSANDPHLLLVGGARVDYLVFNELSPNNKHALANIKVRQAVEYAVNKKAIIRAIGGPTLVTCTGTILPPLISGYQKYDLYPTPDCAGDSAKAKSMLAAAGFPHGITLTYLFRNKGDSTAIASTNLAELSKAGITLKLKQVNPADFYTQHLQHLPAIKSGDWDIAVLGWTPDWAGNAARSFFVPLLDGRLFGEGTTNYGDYNNPEVNKLSDQALEAPNADAAAEIWAQIDQKTMHDAPWVPIDYRKSPRYYGKFAVNCVILPGFSDNCDPTNIWKK